MINMIKLLFIFHQKKREKIELFLEKWKLVREPQIDYRAYFREK